MRLLTISGSLRAASHNTALLRAAAELAPAGVEVLQFEGLDRLPHYNEDFDTDDPDREVQRLREQIAGADVVLISTPEYNGSMPGHLKGAVDWASRPFGPGIIVVGQARGGDRRKRHRLRRRVGAGSSPEVARPRRVRACSTSSSPCRRRRTGSGRMAS